MKTWKGQKWSQLKRNSGVYRTQRDSHLPRKYPTHADDAQDVEHGWAHYGTHPHISMCYEHTCKKLVSWSTASVDTWLMHIQATVCVAYQL